MRKVLNQGTRKRGITKSQLGKKEQGKRDVQPLQMVEFHIMLMELK